MSKQHQHLWFVQLKPCFLGKKIILIIFQFGIIFISFSCLIALARISNAMLNKSGKSGYTYIVPDLKENAFVFSPLSMMLAMDLSHMASIMLTYVPLPELIL